MPSIPLEPSPADNLKSAGAGGTTGPAWFITRVGGGSATLDTMKRFMKTHTLLIAAAFLAVLPIGCSKHSPETPKAANVAVIQFGVIPISVGNPSLNVLGDGRMFCLTPTLIKTNGTVDFIANFGDWSVTNIDAPLGREITMDVDKKTIIAVTLKIPQ